MLIDFHIMFDVTEVVVLVVAVVVTEACGENFATQSVFWQTPQRCFECR